ncbi:kinase-like domain-containing protein [Glomus cerebriforme]|uniref:Kinase-like domain-containing protein n=1 Tax=Glomus cerebriforme TaxID=658196 RepID=A0A397TF16_9GLOM|nr:kinase-like domain-containing protein [Glomus cerebriforme]
MDKTDSDTELDIVKQGLPSRTAGSLDPSTSSYSLCGTSTSTISETLISELDTQKLAQGCLERYADEAGDSRYASKKSSITDSVDFISTDSALETETIRLREKIIHKAIKNIKSSMQVDLCFVLDCTGSMSSYITAAKNCIQQVVEHMESTNPNIKLWIGFCGYRDHCDGSDRLQIFEFTDSYSKFKSYLSDQVEATGGGDGPEDVLGGLDAAVNKMKWSHRTRILLHLCDAPPHGRHFTSQHDNYPDGDPNGLTAESVLKDIKSAELLYYFGKITNQTDKMINIFQSIIGEFPVFDLDTDGKDPKALTAKLFEAICSSITSSVTLTSITDENVYERRKKNLEKDSREPDWDTLPVKTGKLLHYLPPKTLADIKDPKYFKNKSNLILRKFSYKHAPKPFSSGAERYAYFALDVTHKLTENIVIKECIDLGKKANSLERYLEMIEVSTVAYFLSAEFNSVAKKSGIKKKVNFLKPQALRHKDDSGVQCYAVEPKFRDDKFKRFNVNRGVIKEYHSTLEAFAHFTYEHTGGYLVVTDLQGVELENKFLLTDPAIHCTDRLRFGRTNLGKRGIKDCFLANHKCGNVCEKLGLTRISR